MAADIRDARHVCDISNAEYVARLSEAVFNF